MKNISSWVNKAVSETTKAANTAAKSTREAFTDTPTRTSSSTTTNYATPSSTTKTKTSRKSASKHNNPDATSIPREELLHLSMKLSKRLKNIEAKQRTTKEQRDTLQTKCTGLTSIVSKLLEQIYQSVEQQGDHNMLPHDVHGASLQDIHSYTDTALEALSSLSILPAATTTTTTTTNLSNLNSNTSSNTINLNPNNPNNPMTSEESAITNNSNSNSNNSANALTSNTNDSNTTNALSNDTTSTTTTTVSTPPTPTPSLQNKQLLSLRTNTDNLRKTLEQERTQRTALEQEVSSMREQSEHLKAQSEEQILYLKLKLDAIKRTREENENVHSKMLKEHIIEINNYQTTMKETDKQLQVLSNENAVLHDTIKVRKDIENTKHAATLQEKVNKLETHSHDRVAEAEEAIERANQTTVALTEAMVQLEQLRSVSEEHRSAHVTAQEMVKRLQTSLDTAAAQRGDAFSALDSVRSDYDVSTKRRRSNVAVIIVRIVFISSFLFYCLLSNHIFQTNPNRITNCSKLFALLQLTTTLLLRRFLIFEQDVLNKNEKYERTIKKNRIEVDAFKVQVQALLRDKETNQQRIQDLEANLMNMESTITKRLEMKYSIDSKEQERMTKQFQNNKNREKKIKDEMDRLRREFQKKSGKARVLVEAKEREIRDMRLSIDSLKIEVESGRPQERQILQFAQTQAKREGIQKKMKLEIYNLNQTLLKTTNALELQHKQSKHLRTTLQRRVNLQGVNMEYLRNIVLRYMSLDYFGSERLQLVPALASLLDFTKTELAGLDGANRELVRGWWRAAVEQRKNALEQKKKERTTEGK